MVSTQIQLPEEIADHIKTSAAREGVSMAEYFRRLAARDMAGTRQRSGAEIRERAIKTAGRFHSGKERHLGEPRRIPGRGLRRVSVLVDTSALDAEVLPALEIHWVDEGTQRSAVHALLVAARRDLSLVDCVSLEVMRRLGTDRAFTLDQHFSEQGFQVLPAR